MFRYGITWHFLRLVNNGSVLSGTILFLFWWWSLTRRRLLLPQQIVPLYLQNALPMKQFLLIFLHWWLSRPRWHNAMFVPSTYGTSSHYTFIPLHVKLVISFYTDTDLYQDGTITSGSRGGGAPGAPPPLTAADLWFFIAQNANFSHFFLRSRLI